MRPIALPLFLYRRIIHAIDHHGVRGLFRKALRLDPSTAATYPDEAAPHPFDRLHNVDTSGIIPGEKLVSGSLSDLYNTAYYGISPSTLQQALALLPDPVHPYTFIDLGCGKGRALLVAAQLPFHRILGVEISPELARTAQTNTAADTRITVQAHDAATFPFPAEPLVIFLYHPFLPPVLRRVLRNLQLQRTHLPHPTFLLYANPSYPKLIAKFPFLHLVWHHRLPLSAEDAAVDRHGTVEEVYALYQVAQPHSR